MSTVHLRLSSPRDLFETPAFDLCSDHLQLQSGVAEIYDHLKVTSLRGAGQLVLHLPPGAVGPNTAGQLAGALQRYCAYQIEHNRLEWITLRWKGIKALQIGLLVLAICLSLSTLFGHWESLPEFLSSLLSEGFLIAGWVSLWYPTEVLLYEAWPLSRENQIYRYIERMQVEVLADPLPDPASA